MPVVGAEPGHQVLEREICQLQRLVERLDTGVHTLLRIRILPKTLHPVAAPALDLGQASTPG